MEKTTQYAGFLKRAGALVIDSIVLVTISFLVITSVFMFLSLLHINLPDDGVKKTRYAIGFVISAIYTALFESSKYQATPGKMVLGIQVSNMYGDRITFVRALIRHFGKYLSGLLFCAGYLMIFFTEKKQCLHDKLAECLVVKKNKAITVSDESKIADQSSNIA